MLCPHCNLASQHILCLRFRQVECKVVTIDSLPRFKGANDDVKINGCVKRRVTISLPAPISTRTSPVLWTVVVLSVVFLQLHSQWLGYLWWHLLVITCIITTNLGVSKEKKKINMYSHPATVSTIKIPKVIVGRNDLVSFLYSILNRVGPDLKHDIFRNWQIIIGYSI